MVSLYAKSFIEDALAVEDGYSDKPIPVLITSGSSLTPFFVNAEKLSGDENVSKILTKFKNSPLELINYFENQALENNTFEMTIELLSDAVFEMFEKVKNDYDSFAISGGQRRDWIFSGPVANNLDVPHIALFKPDSSIPASAQKFIRSHEDNPIYDSSIENVKPLEGTYVVHIADMLTKGSSMHSVQNENALGWIPQLRSRGATIDNVISVVTRLQGGEQLLESLGVNSTSFVKIDEAYVSKFSDQPIVAKEYIKDETAWTKKYLLENGVDVLVPYAEPGLDENKRLRSFLTQYENFLHAEGLYNTLANKMMTTHKVDIEEFRKIKS